ncbi:MAG: hypothetical protein IPG09_18205 [Ignavibacteria bacterium]|nr:hypothetical protein [Ignavibacteria bacterium]
MPIEVHLVADNLEKTVDNYYKLKSILLAFILKVSLSMPLELIGKIKDAGSKVGIVINPITPLENLTSFCQLQIRLL